MGKQRWGILDRRRSPDAKSSLCPLYRDGCGRALWSRHGSRHAGSLGKWVYPLRMRHPFGLRSACLHGSRLWLDGPRLLPLSPSVLLRSHMGRLLPPARRLLPWVAVVLAVVVRTDRYGLRDEGRRLRRAIGARVPCAEAGHQGAARNGTEAGPDGSTPQVGPDKCRQVIRPARPAGVYCRPGAVLPQTVPGRWETWAS